MDESSRLFKGMDRKLYRASESGDAQLLDRVLKEGTTDIFQQVTVTGDTALHMAIFYSHCRLARKLIQKASDNPEAGMQFLKAQNTDGNTALHLAAKEGCEKTVKGLLEKDRSLAFVKNKSGETALFKASENGHEGIVECLLNCPSQNENENEEADRRADGQTPLHLAVSQLHIGVIKKLLDKTPGLVCKADGWDRTALHILALVPLIKPIGPWWTQRDLSNGWTPTTKGYIQNIGKIILDSEISLLYRVDANCQSALHLAAKVGNAPLVKVILSYGSDCTHISDKDGRTALHLIVENASQAYDRVGKSDLEIIISSLTSKRLIDCSDKSGQTALDIAIQKTEDDASLFPRISEYLKQHGALPKFETETRRQKSFFRMDIVSINAVLIATVAFAAAFTVPGNIDSNANPPAPFLLNVSLFKLFIIFDTVAFCSSVSSAVLLIYALFGNQKEDQFITTYCMWGIWVALTCIALAFGAAIHLVVAPKCLWLAVLVWLMVCSVPFGVRLMSMQGKMDLFIEHKQYSVILVVQSLGLMGKILWDGCMPLYSLLAFVWGYLILPCWRMLVQILSWTRK